MVFYVLFTKNPGSLAVAKDAVSNSRIRLIPKLQPACARYRSRFCIVGLVSVLLIEVSPLPQLLRRHAQGAIELTRCVFPGDCGGQLHQSIFIEESAQALKKFITDVMSRDCHGIGEFERQAFLLSKEVAVRIIFDGFNLVVGNSELAAHGSIYILSKLATVEEGDAPIDQCSQTRFN